MYFSGSCSASATSSSLRLNTCGSARLWATTAFARHPSATCLDALNHITLAQINLPPRFLVALRASAVREGALRKHDRSIPMHTCLCVRTARFSATLASPIDRLLDVMHATLRAEHAHYPPCVDCMCWTGGSALPEQHYVAVRRAIQQESVHLPTACSAHVASCGAAQLSRRARTHLVNGSPSAPSLLSPQVNLRKLFTFRTRAVVTRAHRTVLPPWILLQSVRSRRMLWPSVCRPQQVRARTTA